MKADKASALEEMFMRKKLTKSYTYLEKLLPYLNNPSEETMF